jgi:hypothetical protein
MTDLLCITCGYQLTGLKKDGPCPECGTPIENSLGGERLAGAEPKWLRRVVRGQMLLDIGIKVSVSCFLLLVILPLALAFMAMAGNRTFLTVLAWSTAIMALLGLAGQVTAAVGAFMVTVRDPRLSLIEPAVCARTITRWGMLAMPLLFVAAQTSELLLPIEVAELAKLAFLVMLFGSLTVTLSALLRHLARLAERVPDQPLRSTSLALARNLQWLLPVTVLLMIVPSIVRAVIAPSGGPFDTLTAITSCVGLVFGLFLVIMLVRLSKLMTAYRRAFAGCLTAVPANPPAPH